MGMLTDNELAESVYWPLGNMYTSLPGCYFKTHFNELCAKRSTADCKYGIPHYLEEFGHKIDKEKVCWVNAKYTHNIDDAGIREIVKSFPNLQILVIDANRITDEAFAEIRKLTKLTHLEVNINPKHQKLTAASLGVITSLPNLEMLDMEGNFPEVEYFNFLTALKKGGAVKDLRIPGAQKLPNEFGPFLLTWVEDGKMELYIGGTHGQMYECWYQAISWQVQKNLGKETGNKNPYVHGFMKIMCDHPNQWADLIELRPSRYFELS